MPLPSHADPARSDATSPSGPRTLDDYGQEVRDEVRAVREVVARLHTELPRWQLVVWTAGNVSQRLTTAGLFVIKPSGVSYDELSPEAMVVCDLDAELVDGTRSPSSDTAAHAYVYRQMPEVFGVVHTHSTYATAWAARGEPIPCVLTMMADEFGGPVPVGPFAVIGDDSIGRGIVQTLRESRSPAVLMQNHGPFTVGPDARSAVKSAVMVEEVARTVHIARQLGEPLAIPPETIDRLYDRYQNVYGQPAVKPNEDVMSPDPFAGKQIWFLTGSQALYGAETLAQVAEQSRRVAETLDAADTIPVPVVWKEVLTTPDSIFRTILEAGVDESVIGVVAWMHTFSPAKMWIRGLEALQKPLLHLHTQANEQLPWASIDMDFMNLNQAAHGDREFGYILTRLGVQRTTVVGPYTNPSVTGRIGTWARAAVAWDAATHLTVARFGDNMRYVAVTEGDKTEAEIRLGTSVNTWGVTELAQAVDAVDASSVGDLVRDYLSAYDVPAELQPGGDRHESLQYAARQELAMRGFLVAVGASAFTDTFEDLGALRQLPGLAVQRLMADGYGFGAEGDWKTALLVRIAKVMGHGLPGGASLMEDYSYNFVPGEEKILGAHMLEVCPSLTTATPRVEIHPLGIGDREDPVRLVFDADPGPGLVLALADLRERFRITANTVTLVPPDEPLPKLPVARAVWEPAPDLVTSATAWLTSGAAHHTVMDTASPLEAWQDFARIAGIELALIDESTTLPRFEEALRWNAAYHRLAQRL